MTFTAEQRAKGLQVRLENKRLRDEAKAHQPLTANVVEEEFQKAFKASWQLPERNDWEQMDLDLAHALIQRIQAAYQEGAKIYNQRTYDKQRVSGKYRCIVCQKIKPTVIDNHPNYVWRDDRPDPQTNVYTSRFICSSECFFRGSNSGRLTNAGVPANVSK